MRTPETRVTEVLASALLKLLKKAENEGLDLYNDTKSRKTLRKLQREISTWGFE